jgi:multicomponent Na+:H+ antiporter subunit C
METVLAFVVGGLYAAGLYMMVRRSFVKMIIGIGLLTQAANLLIFTLGRLVRARPPLIPEGLETSELPVADPLPQAIILTAIVIGFGVQAFSLALIKRVYDATGTDDIDKLTSTDT